MLGKFDCKEQLLLQSEQPQRFKMTPNVFTLKWRRELRTPSSQSSPLLLFGSQRIPEFSIYFFVAAWNPEWKLLIRLVRSQDQASSWLGYYKCGQWYRGQWRWHQGSSCNIVGAAKVLEERRRHWETHRIVGQQRADSEGLTLCGEPTFFMNAIDSASDIWSLLSHQFVA